MNRLTGTLSKKVITLRNPKLKGTIYLLPLNPLDPYSKNHVTDLINSVKPDAIAVDCCDMRMTGISWSMEGVKDGFRTCDLFAEATKSTKGNNSKGNKNGYYLHVLMHGIFQHFTDLSSVVKGMHLILDYSTDIYPGAEYELAYQLLRKQKEEKKDDTYDENTDFYCFDRCYTTTCDRIWAGMSWSELYNFYCDINKISDAMNRIMDAHHARCLPKEEDEEIMNQAYSLMEEKHHWVHSVIVNERAALFSLNLESLLPYKVVSDSKSKKEEEEEEEEEGEVMEEKCDRNPVIVALVTKAMVPGILVEWCTSREEAEQHSMFQFLTATSSDSAQGLGISMTDIKASIEEDFYHECKKREKEGITQEMYVANQLNTYRGVLFESPYPFTERDISAAAANRLRIMESLDSQPSTNSKSKSEFLVPNRNISVSTALIRDVPSRGPTPFDIIKKNSKQNGFRDKSSAFSRLRRE